MRAFWKINLLRA